MELVSLGLSLLTDPKHTRWIAACAIVGEALLCGLVIWRVPYTEIDYTTYMHQASLFLNGERNYGKITGPTGPLVYPAVHVYIYSTLHYLTTMRNTSLTGLKCTGGTNCRYEVEVDIGTAQIIFAALYLFTLAVVMACYRRVNAPPWLLIPLVLSKRLHSIFVLRLFNDAWAALAFWLAIYSLQRRRWSVGAILWSLGVGIKMTVLLAAPAIGVILIQGTGLADAFFLGCTCLVLQVLLAMPFLQGGAAEYIRRAFDFGRQFLFKWTVNWRFLGEETFTSREFAISLLVLHVSFLVIFLEWKWVRASSKGIVDFVQKWTFGLLDKAEQENISRKITPTFVMDTMLGSMVIGLLCARSLHYQFYAYLGWASPYLLWRGGGNPVWVLANWAVQEYCWLVFPSTNLSSSLVVLELTLQMLSALMAPPVDHIAPPMNVQGQMKTKVSASAQ